MHLAATVEDAHAIAIADAARFRVHRVNPHLLAAGGFQHVDVTVGGVNTRFVVEAGQLQREFRRQRIVIVFKARRVDRQRIDNIPFRQLPSGGDFCQRFGIDFDFARRRGQRVRLRIFTERFVRHVVSFRIALFVHPLLAEGIKVREVRNCLTGEFMQMAHPPFLSTPLGELLLNA